MDENCNDRKKMSATPESTTPESPPNEKPTSTEESVTKRELRPDEWMFRFCDMYKEEYDDCKSIRARFHQYFIHGYYLDCTQWKKDYENCYLWEKYQSEKAYEQLVESEKKRRAERLKGHVLNNVWERRDKPPENWNAPLPEWMEKEFKNSFLDLKSQEMKGQDLDLLRSQRLCTIL